MIVIIFQVPNCWVKRKLQIEIADQSELHDVNDGVNVHCPLHLLLVDVYNQCPLSTRSQGMLTFYQKKPSQFILRLNSLRQLCWQLIDRIFLIVFSYNMWSIYYILKIHCKP